MALLQLAWLMTRRRLAAAWRPELVLFLGLLLSVAILSGSVVFSDLLAAAALRRALQEAPADEVNFWVRIYHNLEEPATAAQRDSLYQSAIDFVDRQVSPQFRPYLDGEARLLETATFFFGGAARFEQPQDVRPRGRVQYLTGLAAADRSKLTAGRWPAAPPPLSAGAAVPPVIEAAIENAGAQLVGLTVGDELALLPTAGTLNQQPTRARIVGLFDRVNPDADFWRGRERSFSHHNGQWATVPLFTTEAAILEQLAAVYPGLYANATWIFDLNRQGIRPGDVAALQRAIPAARRDIAANLENSTVGLRLDRLLNRYSEQLTLARIPLFLMVFLVVGILAYYLALVSGLTVRARSGEMALLKSRGATTGQIALLMLVEALALAVPAIIIGTLLAAPTAGLLGRLFFDLEGGGAAAALSYRAFLLGAGGALLAALVLTLSTLAAARQGIVEFRQAGARPPRASWFHRYYLDLLLLALLGFLWWQIQSRDSFLLRPAGAGELQIDFTLLLSPALGLVALALLTLRFFPWTMSLLSRLAEPIGPVWLVQGLRRVGRDPMAPGSLVALLMLATALGVIGSAFTATLQRSQADQARYQVGADLRIRHSGDRNPVTDYGLTDGAAAASLPPLAEVRRTSGALLTQGLSSTRLSVLAVDAASFAPAAWFRSDFAGGQSLPELMATLQPAANPPAADYGIDLPPEAAGLSLWVNPGRPDYRLALLARLRDARGYHFDAFLGEPAALGWQQLTGELTPLRRRGQASPPELTPPYTLLNLQVDSRFGLDEPGVVFFDELAAVAADGRPIAAAGPDWANWAVIADYARPGLYALESSPALSRADGRPAAAFSWAPGGLGLRGIRPGPADRPAPVIVSPEVLEIADAGVGDELTLSVGNFAMPVQVAAIADYFPTLDPREQPFIVLDGSAFAGYANRHGRRPAGGPEELWAALPEKDRDNAAAIAAINAALSDRGLEVAETRQAAAEIRQRTARPLTNASWGGLLALMFLALTLASASGVALFSYVDTGERRTEFALLRTMGAATGQLNGMVWFNLLLILVCGVGLGTWAGQQIGNALLPALEVAEGGLRVTPPMALQTNGLTLLAAYLTLAVVAAANGIWLAWFTARLEVQQVLRAGEGV